MPRRTRGVCFKPGQKYTHRLSKILEEYPDGSQILREILQNSDDAKSRQQTFILDRNSYPTQTLFEPNNNGTERNDLKLDRYQGPALLSRNDTIFEEDDLISLVNLANSYKRAMGLSFNSIYHITDSPSFITDDSYVILDPHEWYYDGGVQFDFVEEASNYPDQFAPFRIPCNIKFKGTLFRYPLRTSEDAIDSSISKKVYRPDDILEMFQKFYENESINCLLFLKYIEVIKFYELNEGEADPNLLYEISLENADEVRSKRQLIAKNIMPMMKSLGSNDSNRIKELNSIFIANFCRQEGKTERESISWVIFNWLSDLNVVNNYFQENFKKDIKAYKFVPNVGLAMRLDSHTTNGRLFCFLPLPIFTPFHTSINGYLAVSTNRRTIWTPADNEYLAVDASASLKASWNKYLFDDVLPKAWARFLVTLPDEYPSVQPKQFYDFWPVFFNQVSSSIVEFCKEILENVVENLNIDDEVFLGPSASYLPGNMQGLVQADSNVYVKKNTEFPFLSIVSGYFPPDQKLPAISEILGKIGFPVIVGTDPTVKSVLEKSRHSSVLQVYSLKIIKTYLRQNQNRLQDLSRVEISNLFCYVLQDKDTSGLEGLQMIPLADGTLGTISKVEEDIAYICFDQPTIDMDCEHKIFNKDLKKFIDSLISPNLRNLLYEGAKNKWNINIKILDQSIVANLIKKNLKGYTEVSDEIELEDQREWIYMIWENFLKRKYELKDFESLHLILTNQGTLRKIRTNEKCFWNGIDDEIDNKLQPLVEKFGVVFVDKDFEKRFRNILPKLSPYVVNLTELPTDSLELIKYLREQLKIGKYSDNDSGLSDAEIDVIKSLPIFSEIGHKGLTSLHENKEWFLLPKEEEREYDYIITPNSIGFLDVNLTNTRYILENIIKVTRLTQKIYWREYVIPYLISQPVLVFNKMVEKLFDRLEVLLRIDSTLKGILGKLPFVTTGTHGMFKGRLNSDVDIERRGPMELYNPEDREIIDLFFEDEKVFPCGNFSPKLSLLKELGLKTVLLPDDIIDRLRVFQNYKNKPMLFDIVHTKTMKLLKYVDNYWKAIFDKTSHGNEQLFSEILALEWIPTVDHLGRKHFSKSSRCGDLEKRYLIGHVVPILNYRIRNKEFLQYLGWNESPDIELILSQLQKCSQPSMKVPQIYEICKAIYSHMNTIVTDNGTEIDTLKEKLGDTKWILVNRQFYSSENVVFDLPKDFGNKDTLLVGLPDEYKYNYKELFERMGVRLKIGIKDYINIIKGYGKDYLDIKLPADEIHKVVGLIDQISRKHAEDKSSAEILQELLIPTTQEILKSLSKVQYDDMGSRLTDEEKTDYIAHPSISLSIAKNIGMRMLSVKEINRANESFIMPDFYGQNETLITRIRNIINDYLPVTIFKEFLQNADDAGARTFKVYIDKRDFKKKDRSSLLTEGMHYWQGPALWIYNDAEFSENDFKSLPILGESDKLSDKTKIGRFGIGFNSVYNLTDFPSFVSGEYIIFFDPHSKYLPEQGYPPRNPLGSRYNFVKAKFGERWKSQAEPYLSVEGCELMNRYNGTLFRIPLRTYEANNSSEISGKRFDPGYLLELFKNIQGNREMFLRNIEECSLHCLDDNQSKLIWKTRINNMDENIRNMRRSITKETKIFQLNIEMQMYNHVVMKHVRGQMNKILEHWLLCSGGNEEVREDLKNLSDEKKPRGAVAALIANMEENDKKGAMYSYLSLSINNGLSVMLNGDFFLSSNRNKILYSESAEIEAKWNRYILLEVLPSLHAKLLNEIAIRDSQRFASSHNQNKMFLPYVTTRDWPIKSTSEIYRTFGLTVFQELTRNNYRVFWTETNGGEFVSFTNAVFGESKKEYIIPDLLMQQKVQIVKISEEQYKHLEELPNTVSPNFITPDLVCNTFHNKKDMWDSYKTSENQKVVKKAIDYLLRFILGGTEPQDIKTYEKLIGLPLVPLYGDAVGTFCEMEYYIAEEDYRKLFNKTRLSRFVTELPFEIKNKEISKLLKIFELDANSILNLLEIELPIVEQMDWDPSGESYPNKKWLGLILAKFRKDSVFEFRKLARFPLLPKIYPHQKLIRFDKSSPLLFQGGNLEYPLIHALRCNEKNNELDADSLKIIQSLPIWPTYPQGSLIAANRGCLLNSKLKICSSSHEKIFKVESGKYYDTLSYLNPKSMNELEYITNYYECTNVTPDDDEYLEFLKSVLILENDKIENYLKNNEVIPNKDRTALVEENALYDINVELFREIFRNTDKFLPIGLQENENILCILERVGLKRCINSNSFIECAREIESKIRITPKEDIKSLARRLVTELFLRYDKLRFNPQQLKDLLSIKFVPTDRNLQEYYGIHMDEIVSLTSACFYKYKDLVWTQVPLIDKWFDDPPIKFLETCKPELWDVINHWETVATTSIIAQTERSDRKYYGERKRFQDMMTEIYEYIDSQINDRSKEIKSRIRGKKLFLNGDDPLEPESWVLGSSLVYGISEDIGQNLHKVSPFLEKYKALLKLAGAEELIRVKTEREVREYNQKTFKKIYANRYVLSAATQYFKQLFHNKMIEGIENKKVTVNVNDDFKPNTFRVLFLWLYGQSFEEASKAVSPKSENYVAFLIDLLKASNKYLIDPLKDILEEAIKDKCDITNVIEIVDWAKFCNAEHLRKHCLKYIKENKKLLSQKISKDVENTKDKQ
ncbi:205_t:CDS:10 [Acaulospora colombiana]|uniref:205_t:CDS:1 n=1 Tax=Acaulospora colombiana TaxID=27376 RepID=A0ACA9K2I9_9GLOM|nr:205_t:CDS:10 [Acaulospora colombiana]